VLFSYGGGGPLHSATLAHELSIPTIIVPPEPGNFSAIGMLLADARKDKSQTYIKILSDQSLNEAIAISERMSKSILESLQQEIGHKKFFNHHFADLRYQGQIHAISIQITSLKSAKSLMKKFNEAYISRFGHINQISNIEFVAIRCTVTMNLPHPALQAFDSNKTKKTVRTNHQFRNVFFSQVQKFVKTPIFNRSNLSIGFKQKGPAVIQEYGSCTLVGPDDDFEIGTLGEININIGIKRMKNDSYPKRKSKN